jgi:hypothetical protein
MASYEGATGQTIFLGVFPSFGREKTNLTSTFVENVKKLKINPARSLLS